MTAALTIGEALVAAQAKMPAVEPDKTATVPTKTGGSFSYSYVSLGHLIAKTRPVLNEHGLAIIQSVGVLETGQPVLRTVIVHTSGERIDAGETPLFSDKSMQQLGGAVTYARRYGWAAALGIADQADDDAQGVAEPKAADISAEQKTPAPAAAVATSLAAPSGLRSDAQAKMLHGLLPKLVAAGAITDEQFVNAAHGQGATGDDATACIASIGKVGASSLISRLKTLETNHAAAAPEPVPVGAPSDSDIPF